MGVVASALFEMKKGAAFLIRQDQQNDAQIFVSFFEKNTAASQERPPLKKGAERMHLPEKGEVPGSNLGGGSETVIKIFCFKEKIRASKSPETVDAPGFCQTHLYR